MANVLLPAHLSCYTHPFTLSLSEFLKILSFFLFFFPLGKVNNWKYNLSDKPYGSFQRWVSVLSEMDFGHVFSVLAPHFPYKKFHNLQNSCLKVLEHHRQLCSGIQGPGIFSDSIIFKLPCPHISIPNGHSVLAQSSPEWHQIVPALFLILAEQSCKWKWCSKVGSNHWDIAVIQLMGWLFN